MNTEQIATKGLKLDDSFEFKKDSTMEELIKEFKNHVVLCRNCAIESFCKVKPPNEDICLILDKLVENFIETHIPQINKANQKEVTIFCQSLYHYIDSVEVMKLMIGLVADDALVKYFGKGSIPDSVNRNGRKLAQILNDFLTRHNILFGKN